MEIFVFVCVVLIVVCFFFNNLFFILFSWLCINSFDMKNRFFWLEKEIGRVFIFF